MKLINHLKIGFGKVLGSIWEGSGSVCGVSWALLGPSWPFFGRSKASFFKALIQDRLQEAFWIDFGRVWAGFGRVWRGIWEHLEAFGQGFGSPLGRLWGASWATLERSWLSLRRLLAPLGILGTSWAMLWFLGRFSVGLWKGFGKLWGGICKGFGTSKSTFWSCFVLSWT